jgi:hypothetical protein
VLTADILRFRCCRFLPQQQTFHRRQFRVSPSDSLKSLRTAISASEALGRVRIADQRLFYLGKEIVAARTVPLSSLGFGGDQASKFGGACVVHVHSRRPPSPPRTGTQKREVAINDVDEGDGDGEDDVVFLDDPQPPPPRARKPRALRQQPQQPPPPSGNQAAAAKEVIDLLDDSSDDEETVIVASASTADRRTKRQRTS